MFWIVRVGRLKSISGSGTDLARIGPLKEGPGERPCLTRSCLQIRPTFPPSPLTSRSGLGGEDRQERGEQVIQGFISKKMSPAVTGFGSDES